MSKADERRNSPTSPDGDLKPSRASAGRFSLYLRFLQRLQSEGQRTVSSSQLGEALGITDAQVRKDLAYLGNLGHRGVGYPVPELSTALKAVLGVNRPWKVILVGVGNLAKALLRYRGFEQQGFHIVALFDSDPTKIGQEIAGMPIHSLNDLAVILPETGAELAILTVPSEVAQTIADQLVVIGIRGILNFAPVILRLPPTIQLVTVDLAVQLEQLASLIHLTSSD